MFFFLSIISNYLTLNVHVTSDGKGYGIWQMDDLDVGGIADVDVFFTQRNLCRVQDRRFQLNGAGSGADFNSKCRSFSYSKG